MSADTFNTPGGGEYFKLTKSEPISPLYLSLQKPTILSILDKKNIENFRLMPIEGDYFVHDDNLYVVTAVSYINGPSVTARRVDFTSGKHWEESKFSMDDIKGKTISVSEACDRLAKQLGKRSRVNEVLEQGYINDRKTGKIGLYSATSSNRLMLKPEGMGVDDNGRRGESPYIDTSSMNSRDGLKIIHELPVRSRQPETFIKLPDSKKAFINYRIPKLK